MLSTQQSRRQFMTMDRSSLEAYQLERLNRLLAAVLPENEFYARKLGTKTLRLTSLDDLRHLPFTTKSELVVDAEGGSPPANATYSRERYQRYHQTSGSKGNPLVVLDTADDWRWWTDCWQYVLDAAAITARDRALLAFSFGPFIGFWSACDALLARGAMVVPGGGMTSLMRLDLLQRGEANVLLCTPSYALRLAEVAAEEGIHAPDLPIRKIIVAGEPGGSIPAIVARLEAAWNATVYDHAGASEIGPWGFPDANRIGLHILEAEFAAEFLAIRSDAPAPPGEPAELVLTTLGRDGCPVIRYRTGDVVKPMPADEDSAGFVLLEGGVLGRADDMLTVRGMNVFPSAVDAIVQEFDEVGEYRLTAHRPTALDTLVLEVEDSAEDPQRIASALQRRLGLMVNVKLAAAGSLPRFEGKARRFVDMRSQAENE